MIGVISDTHDNVVNIKKAVEKFKKAGVEFVIHCGDIVAPGTVRFFKGVKLKAALGNCEGDIETEKKKLEEIGGEYLGEIGEIKYRGKNICVYHGADPLKLEELINSGKYDYIFTGHTHKKRDERIGNTRVVNPGAHYYGAENSIVFFDADKDEVRFVELNDKRDRILLCILAAVIHDGKILLIKRAKEPYKGYWSMTGGKVEFAEHIEETAKREVLEETGLNCEVEAIKGVVNEIVHGEDGAEQHFLMFLVQLKPDKTEFTESDEGELQWVRFEDIDKLEPMVPSDKLMIKELLLSKNKMDVHRVKVKRNGDTYDVEEFL